MKYDDRMDPECVAVCDALNALPGIETFESCCGHGERSFRVYFFAAEVSSLVPVRRALDHQWEIVVTYVDLPYRITFRLEGPIDRKAGDELVPYLTQSESKEHAE